MIGAPLTVLSARPSGLWRAWLLARTAPDGRLSRTLRDGAALSASRCRSTSRIYAGGAGDAELLRGAAGAILYMFALGRPYGVFLDLVRGLFGLSAGGQKPMSPGG